MPETPATRWLSERLTAKCRSLFAFVRSIGHWGTRKDYADSAIMKDIFRIADAEKSFARDIAAALEARGIQPRIPGPVDYSHLHYMRPDFLLSLCLKQKQQSLAGAEAAPDLSNDDALLALQERLVAAEREHLASLESHRVSRSQELAAAPRDIV